MHAGACLHVVVNRSWPPGKSMLQAYGGRAAGLGVLPLVLRLALLECLGAPTPPLGGPASCNLPAGLELEGQQAAAFAWASRGSLRRAVPCFAAALQRSAHHPWLWVDYARALQGAVRNEERVVRGCEGVTLASWQSDLDEAEAAAHVALLLNDVRDVDAARLVLQRLAKTSLRHDELDRACGSASPNASVAERQSASRTAWLVASLAAGRPRSLNDAVELGRARCTNPNDVSADFGHGWATATAVRDALLSLRVCGVVRLRSVWKPTALDAVAAAHRREFEDYLQTTGITLGANAATATKRGVQRWQGRWESQLPLAPPFDDPSLTMHPSLLAVMQSALGSARLELDTFTQITSIGGAGNQPFHADVGPLWSQQTAVSSDLQAQTRAHGMVCVVPLMNVSNQLRGPTAFQVASHFLPPVRRTHKINQMIVALASDTTSR